MLMLTPELPRMRVGNFQLIELFSRCWLNGQNNNIEAQLLHRTRLSPNRKTKHEATYTHTQTTAET